MSMDAADRIAIHELLSLYGHLIDQRRWADLDQVFTDDLLYDASDFGVDVTHTRADLLAHWASDERMHPLAHHATNVVISEDPDGTVRVLSKGVGVGDTGRVGSVTYHDVVVRTPAGWRMASRRAELRRPRRELASGARPDRRLDAIESRLDIGQLPIRYAMAVDSRDVDAWVRLFVPDVKVTREISGRAALAEQIDAMLRWFRRSIHQICGQRIVLDPDDVDRASGYTYCRAEHEVDDRWIVMAICYFDDYQRVDGEWLFRRRKEKHWYSADINEHPQAVDFDSWNASGGPPPALPGDFPTWHAFWGDGG
jgi:hypothetical protein